MANNYTDIRKLFEDDKASNEKQSLSKEGNFAGSGRKESESPKAVNYETSIKEVVEFEPQAEKEISEYVQARKDTIKITSDIKKLGAVSTGQPTFIETQQITIPISDEKVYQGLHAPISSSFRWLSEFYMRLLKTAHITLKNVHGKIVRVILK